MAGGIKVNSPCWGCIQMLRRDEIRRCLRQVTVNLTRYFKVFTPWPPKALCGDFLYNLVIDGNPNFIIEKGMRKLYLRIHSMSEFFRFILTKSRWAFALFGKLWKQLKHMLILKQNLILLKTKSVLIIDLSGFFLLLHFYMITECNITSTLSPHS